MRNNALRGAAITSDCRHVGAAVNVLSAVQAVHRIRDEVHFSVEARLHYLRTIRQNLAAAEDYLAGLDDEPAPCVAEKMADVAHDYHRSQEIEQ